MTAATSSASRALFLAFAAVAAAAPTGTRSPIAARDADNVSTVAGIIALAFGVILGGLALLYFLWLLVYRMPGWIERARRGRGQQSSILPK